MAAAQSNPSPLIRTFRFSDDYDAVYRLWADAGDGIHLRRSDDPDEIEKKIRRDPDLFLVAEMDGRIVGSVLGGFDGRRGMMYHLAVAHSHRGRGIGEQLMDELERRLRAKGCIRYYLLVTTDNDTAIRFYEQRGWERMDLYVYGKDLI
ncbi:MAG: GNAT family acetyltransferase [Chloroflexi bacterium]|nr:GNAT family acetyltransferase [Chloroflexota bacterium]